jgi:hypothetical protein
MMHETDVYRIVQMDVENRAIVVENPVEMWKRRG